MGSYILKSGRGINRIFGIWFTEVGKKEVGKAESVAHGAEG